MPASCAVIDSGAPTAFGSPLSCAVARKKSRPSSPSNAPDAPVIASGSTASSANAGEAAKRIAARIDLIRSLPQRRRVHVRERNVHYGQHVHDRRERPVQDDPLAEQTLRR